MTSGEYKDSWWLSEWCRNVGGKDNNGNDHDDFHRWCQIWCDDDDDDDDANEILLLSMMMMTDE